MTEFGGRILTLIPLTIGPFFLDRTQKEPNKICSNLFRKQGLKNTCFFLIQREKKLFLFLLAYAQSGQRLTLLTHPFSSSSSLADPPKIPRSLGRGGERWVPTVVVWEGKEEETKRNLKNLF